MSQTNVDMRRAEDFKASQGVRMNRDLWLKKHDFLDPFHLDAVQAEHDEILKSDEEVFVQVPYYASIVGAPEEPSYHFIFGQTGGGKTAICEAIKLKYDGLLGNDDEPKVLSVIYNSFDQASSILHSDDHSKQALFVSHIEEIVSLILFRLFEIWSDNKKSARLKDIRHRDIKKRIRWYLQKYLRLFPWQFERLRKKAHLRSILPLSDYLIRVLLGAVKSILPPAKPLADELGTFPSQTLEDYVKLNTSAFDLLSELVQLCRQIGFDGVYVLVDDLDNGYPEFEKSKKGFDRIAPLLYDHRLYSSIDRFVLKLFIPQHMKRSVVEAIDTGRMLTVDLDWTEELIRQVYEQRLRSCRTQTNSNENLEPSLANICALDLRANIDKFLLQYGIEKNTPRALIELGFRLLDEHFAVGERYEDELISKATWDCALEKVGKVFRGEEVAS